MLIHQHLLHSDAGRETFQVMIERCKLGRQYFVIADMSGKKFKQRIIQIVVVPVITCEPVVFDMRNKMFYEYFRSLKTL